MNENIERFKKEQLSKALRNERFALQNCVRDLMPDSRVKGCLRYRVDGKQAVGVTYSPVRKQANYSNLQVCGLGWSCPVCSSKISEHRKNELRQAKEKHLKNGGSIYLLTLTNRHHHGDNLGELVKQQAKALTSLWETSAIKDLLKSNGLVGKIRAYEVTYSDNNGFHPHFHYLLFFEKRINIRTVQNAIAKRWVKVCVNKGMKKPTLKNGCDLRNGKKAVEYISKFGSDSEMSKEGHVFAKKTIAKKNELKKYKWGVEHEMTKSMIKKGRSEKALSMFDLLRLYKDGDKDKGALFVVFANAFQGKSQLQWSRGLRDLLLDDSEELTDKEISETSDDTAIPEFDLQLLEWTLIRRYKKRGDFLKCVEYDKQHNEKTATTMIAELAKRYNDELIIYSDKYLSSA